MRIQTFDMDRVIFLGYVPSYKYYFDLQNNHLLERLVSKKLCISNKNKRNILQCEILYQEKYAYQFYHKNIH